MKIPTCPLYYRQIIFEDFENVSFNKMYAVNVQHKKKQVYEERVLTTSALSVKFRFDISAYNLLVYSLEFFPQLTPRFSTVLSTWKST